MAYFMSDKMQSIHKEMYQLRTAITDLRFDISYTKELTKEQMTSLLMCLDPMEKSLLKAINYFELRICKDERTGNER